MMVPATQLRSGMLIIFNGELHRVHDMVHKTPGNLRGFVQAKMRNLRTGSMNEHRFGSTDRVEKASLDEREMEYLYSDSAGHHFMDQATYDQLTLSDEVIGEQMKYLLPNSAIHVDFYEDNPVGIELPNTVTLEVVETQPGMKGATA
jgi:elongation factor P